MTTTTNTTTTTARVGMTEVTLSLTPDGTAIHATNPIVGKRVFHLCDYCYPDGSPAAVLIAEQIVNWLNGKGAEDRRAVRRAVLRVLRKAVSK